MDSPLDIRIPPRRKYTPKQRADIFLREAFNAYIEGRGDGRDPACVHCGLPVLRGIDAFDIAHKPEKPRCMGGTAVGIAHRDCNRNDGARNVVPALAKAERVCQRHLGASAPGLGRHAMRGGVRDTVTRTFRHGVRPRLSAAAKHARVMAKRAILTTLPKPPWQGFPETEAGEE